MNLLEQNHFPGLREAISFESIEIHTAGETGTVDQVAILSGRQTRIYRLRIYPGDVREGNGFPFQKLLLHSRRIGEVGIWNRALKEERISVYFCDEAREATSVIEINRHFLVINGGGVRRLGKIVGPGRRAPLIRCHLGLLLH